MLDGMIESVCCVVVVVVVVILMAFLANLYPLRQLLYGYPILLYGVMLSIACACLLKWEETGVPGGNPRKHGENMQTPHRKARAGPETNPGPSCCEATALTTALTTAPPCRPIESVSFTTVVLIRMVVLLEVNLVPQGLHCSYY